MFIISKCILTDSKKAKEAANFEIVQQDLKLSEGGLKNSPNENIF